MNKKSLWRLKFHAWPLTTNKWKKRWKICSWNKIHWSRSVQLTWTRPRKTMWRQIQLSSSITRAWNNLVRHLAMPLISSWKGTIYLPKKIPTKTQLVTLSLSIWRKQVSSWSNVLTNNSKPSSKKCIARGLMGMEYTKKALFRLQQSSLWELYLRML